MERERRRHENPITRGVRSSVRNDASAFSYSILITVTYGAVNMQIGAPSVGRLILFTLGGTGAFAVLEATSSRMFRVRIREERSDVVVLGTAFAPVAVGAAVGAALGIMQVTRGAVAWFVTPAIATTVYTLLAALQLNFARIYEQRNPPDEQEDN